MAEDSRGGVEESKKYIRSTQIFMCLNLCAREQMPPGRKPRLMLLVMLLVFHHVSEWKSPNILIRDVTLKYCQYDQRENKVY